MNIWALLAGLFSGIAGAMGLGGGAVLIIYLKLFTDTDTLKSGGINLIFFIPIAVLAVVIYAFKKQIKWKTVIPLAIWGFSGAVFGIWLGGALGGDLVGKIFGAGLLIMGIKEVFFGKLGTSEKNA